MAKGTKGYTNNPNGRPLEAKIWADAIKRAIKRREQDDPRALEKLADKLIKKCEEGDISALKEFGDRVEGKAIQQLNVNPVGNFSLTINK